MYVNMNNVQTGRPNQIISTLRRRISALIRADVAFKVGITNNPQARARAYGYEYDEMIVLYTTSSDNYVRDLESALVYEYWYMNDNYTGGGGGGRGMPPYYLYIVRERV